MTFLLLFTMLDSEKDPAFSSTMSPSSRIALATIMTILIIGIPCAFMYLIWKHKDNLDDKEVRTKYGTLWMGLRTKSMNALMYNVVFLTRRFLFALISVFAGPYDAGLALVLQVSLCIAYCLYLLEARPQESPKDQRLELAAEILLLYCFCSILFCEIERRPETKYGFGWFSVICSFTLILVMYLNMLFEAVSKLILYIKIKFRKQLGIKKEESEAEEEEKEEYDSESEEEPPEFAENQQLILQKKLAFEAAVANIEAIDFDD